MNGASRSPAPPIEPGEPGEARRPAARLIGKFLALLLLVGTAAGFWLYLQLRGSLAQLDGVRELAGLEAPVRVERDERGVPTIRGAQRIDVARALGFVHAQERFFQMDLLRRQAAGELAELFGDAALAVDRRRRVHRFRARARSVLAALPTADREILEAYVAGVNAGLEALEARPFEYLLLAAEPRPWQVDDTLLTVYAMYLELNDEEGVRDSVRGLLHDLLGPEMFEFLAPGGTEWDAPLVGEPFVTPPVPAPEALARRGTRSTTPQWLRRSEPTPAVALGSNNWALAASHTAADTALLANDMHLGHAVPNIWYRASLVYTEPDDPARRRRVTGVTLPGAPLVVIGSNGHIAWGYTNTYGDWEDLVVLEPVAGDDRAYLTSDGARAYTVHQEVLRTADDAEEILTVLETVWGPVVDRDYQGRRRALRWIAHEPGAVNLRLMGLEGATDIDEAVRIANQVGAPPQNFVVADAGGRIGWTVMGPIPRRFGHDGRLPVSWAAGSRGWSGWLEPDEYPRLLDPDEGRIWTANNRVVEGQMLAQIGLGSYILGARARQIRDSLRALDGATEGDLLALQLDDRALFLERWRELLLEILSPVEIAADPHRKELRRHVERWGGRAAVDSVGYRMVRAFRHFLAEQVFGHLTAACRQADERFDYGVLHQSEGPLWRLISERPPHLLDPRFGTWEEQLQAAVDATLEYFLEDGARLETKTWGERNTTRIRHPLSAFLPGAARWLDMPPIPLPGDSHMPRYQAPSEGASQRMVVSPGHEDQGIFHMPAGQSGHPLSPHYRDGHRAWAEGRPTPFLPGPPENVLVLRPAESQSESRAQPPLLYFPAAHHSNSPREEADHVYDTRRSHPQARCRRHSDTRRESRIAAQGDPGADHPAARRKLHHHDRDGWHAAHRCPQRRCAGQRTDRVGAGRRDGCR